MVEFVAQPSTATCPARASIPTAIRAGKSWQASLTRSGLWSAPPSTEDHARDAFAEPGVDGRQIADAAAELQRDAHRREYRLDTDAVHRLAGESAIEVDDMQPVASGAGEGPRLVGRILVEHRRLIHFAAHQAHAASFLQIDRGIEDHGSACPGRRDVWK